LPSSSLLPCSAAALTRAAGQGGPNMPHPGGTAKRSERGDGAMPVPPPTVPSRRRPTDSRVVPRGIRGPPSRDYRPARSLLRCRRCATLCSLQLSFSLSPRLRAGVPAPTPLRPTAAPMGTRPPRWPRAPMRPPTLRSRMTRAAKAPPSGRRATSVLPTA
jgi:hypothetical protein